MEAARTAGRALPYATPPRPPPHRAPAPGEAGADPSRAPAPLRSPFRRQRVLRGRGEERAAAGTYLSAVRPLGCARQHGPGGGAELRPPGAALVCPPALPALPHHRPRPWAEAAEPGCAGSAQPCPAKPPWGPRADPATEGPG